MECMFNKNFFSGVFYTEGPNAKFQIRANAQYSVIESKGASVARFFNITPMFIIGEKLPAPNLVIFHSFPSHGFKMCVLFF
jgi:hypothetical protein